MDINNLTYLIRGAIFEVHNELGPGLFESVYEAALIYELLNRGLTVEAQVAIPVMYKDIRMAMGFRADIIVNGEVIIELKSVEVLHNVHKKQLLNYLKLTGMHLGLLVNFNAKNLINKESLIRIIN